MKCSNILSKHKTAIFFSLCFFLCFVFFFPKHTQYCRSLIPFYALSFSRDAGDGFNENKSQEDSTGKTTDFTKSVIFFMISNQCMNIFITFLRFDFQFLYATSRRESGLGTLKINESAII